VGSIAAVGFRSFRRWKKQKADQKRIEMNQNHAAMEFEAQLQSLLSRVEPLERFIQAFAASLPQPMHYYSEKVHHGFRYEQPDVRHFYLATVFLRQHSIGTFNIATILSAIRCRTLKKLLFVDRNQSDQGTDCSSQSIYQQQARSNRIR
jgi:hypothetical protein